MADGISFDRYIENPNSGSMVVTNKTMYRDLYTKKFNNLLVREEGKINYKVYHRDDRYDTYYIHFKIPSEVVEKFYYDVVVQLSTTESPKKANSVLKNYMVRFYSNDPAFVYTFAYAFNKNNMFIKELSNRMDRRALTGQAKVRNPKNEIFYVKSLYFAYLAMIRYKLFDRRVFNKLSIRYDKRLLLKKIAKRREEGEKVRKQNKSEKSNNTKTSRNISKVNKTSPITKTSTISKITPKTKHVKTVKKSNIIGSNNTS